MAPDIQEQIHFLPRTQRGRDSIYLGQLQPIALEPDWRKQRHRPLDQVAKPRDLRVLDAVRKSMAQPNVKAYSTEYHRKLLELSSP